MAMSPCGTRLVAGCEDGCVKLFDVSAGGLAYSHSFDKQGERVLSVAWHSGGIALASGGADSAIRIWNATTGRVTLHIAVETGSADRTLVWAVRLLDDMTVVSGDSRGVVQFWNGTLGTLREVCATASAFAPPYPHPPHVLICFPWVLLACLGCPGRRYMFATDTRCFFSPPHP